MEARRSTRGHLAWKRECQLSVIVRNVLPDIPSCTSCAHFVYFCSCRTICAPLWVKQKTHIPKKLQKLPGKAKKIKTPPKISNKKHKKTQKLNLSAKKKRKRMTEDQLCIENLLSKKKNFSKIVRNSYSMLDLIKFQFEIQSYLFLLFVFNVKIQFSVIQNLIKFR